MKLDNFPQPFFSNTDQAYSGRAANARERECASCDDGKVTTTPTAPSPATPSSSVTVAGATITQMRGAAITVKTRDGDQVTINLNQSYSATLVRGSASGNDGEAQAQSLTLRADSALTYSVSGDLSEEEQDAIKNLLEDVDKLASQFYRGNIQAAFKRATNLGFDTDTLASISINLTQTRTLTAIAAYQNNSAQAPPASVQAPTTTTAAPELTPAANVALAPTLATPATTTTTTPAIPAATTPATAIANNLPPPPATTTTAAVRGGTLPDLVKFLHDLRELLNDVGTKTLLDDSVNTLALLLEQATALKVDIVANSTTLAAADNKDDQEVLKTLINSASKADSNARARLISPDETIAIAA